MMHHTLFARLAAASHPSLPLCVREPATVEALAALRSLPDSLGHDVLRRLVTAVLASGNAALASAALEALPLRTAAPMVPPKADDMGWVSGVVAANWDAPTPEPDAARLWIWANGASTQNPFALLLRAHSGETNTPHPNMMMGLSLCMLPHLTWDPDLVKPSRLANLLQWRMFHVDATRAGIMAPLDAVLAHVPAPAWVEAWHRTSSILALPLLRGFVGAAATVKAIEGTRLAHARKHCIPNLVEGSHHALIRVVARLPERTAFEAMDFQARIDALRVTFGTIQAPPKVRRSPQDAFSPEAQAKRAARQAKAAAAAAAAAAAIPTP